MRARRRPRLSAFCTEPTSITQAEVDDADPFSMVFPTFTDSRSRSEAAARLMECMYRRLLVPERRHAVRKVGLIKDPEVVDAPDIAQADLPKQSAIVAANYLNPSIAGVPLASCSKFRDRNDKGVLCHRQPARITRPRQWSTVSVGGPYFMRLAVDPKQLIAKASQTVKGSANISIDMYQLQTGFQILKYEAAGPKGVRTYEEISITPEERVEVTNVLTLYGVPIYVRLQPSSEHIEHHRIAVVVSDTN